MKYFVGIDPGKTGAWVVLDESGAYRHGGLNETVPELIAVLRAVHDSAMACVESAHAMPGQGTVSMFSFGQSFGLMLGILTALGIPYVLVSSNRWQKEVMDMLPAKADKANDELPSETAKRRQANRKALKDATVAFVCRRWPAIAHFFKLKKNQGIADAACIALYCLKRNS